MFAADRLTVTLQASPALAAVLVGAHGIAATVPWTVAMPWWLAGPASAAILGLCGVAVARDALRRLPSSVIRIELHADGEGRIEFRSGHGQRVRIGSDATVVPVAVVIRAVTPAGRSHGVVITRDACDADAFRRLKVFLRWQQRPGTGADDAGTKTHTVT
jgi:hypothetical protein